MTSQVQGEFLRKRMIELREKNHKSQTDMARLLFVNKSTLSRVENGNSSFKNIREFAMKYCDALNLTEQQKELFMRGEKVVVTDTSALLKNPQLIDLLSEEYSIVIVPDVVIDELDNIIKGHNNTYRAAMACHIIRRIGSQNNVIAMEYTGGESNSKDAKIISVAEQASMIYNCIVDVITNNTGFAARLSGKNSVHALFLEEYMMSMQNLTDTDSLIKLDQYYSDSYDDVETVLGIDISNIENINAFLPNGHTLIISVVRNRRIPLNQRIEKIRWLIRHGANVNDVDCSKYFFPPLSHAIQANEYELFIFLLNECHANPNIGSRNPYDTGKIYQKNDGNTPLMVAAWDNKIPFVKALCADERTSLNQQDGNGFTALTKACYWGWLECRDILIAAGADIKIVDRDGFTAEQRYKEYLATGRRKRSFNYKRKKSGKGRKN